MSLRRSAAAAKRERDDRGYFVAEGLAPSLRRKLEARLADLAPKGITWPSAKYAEDPVGFAREILGVEPWEKEREILEAVRGSKRVAVSSGHKIGKSHAAAILALWFFCSFPDARVVMSSTTARQVDEILWRELRMMVSRAGRCCACKEEDPEGRRIKAPCPHSAVIGATPAALARTGLHSDDFRQVYGFTAREPEAVAGISGARVLYIVDEASGVPDPIFEAIEGNRAGGARIVLFSNPTRNEGEHFEAFNSKAEFYHTIRVSSEETPNVIEGREVIPGLATREWVEEKRAEWGETSAQYLVRVKGLHATQEEGKVCSLHVIAGAEARWHDTEDAGALVVACDPAGPGGMGDESVITAARGKRQIGIWTARGLDDAGHEAAILRVLRAHLEPGERAVLVLDREGEIGNGLWGFLRTSTEVHGLCSKVIGVRSSERAIRQPRIFDRIRDELWANLAKWLEEGSIVEDAKQARELHAPSYYITINGRTKVTDKKELRKALGRSPDRADALALVAWAQGVAQIPDVPPPAPEQSGGGELVNPYAAEVWW